MGGQIQRSYCGAATRPAARCKPRGWPGRRVHGACVRLTAPVEVGAELDIEFRRSGAKKSIKLLADVRWCRPEGGGLYLVGIRLQRRLTAAELANLAR
jgi:PilZ domain